MSLIKSGIDQQKLRKAGKALAEVIDIAVAAAHPGVVLRELDALIHQAIVARGAKPSFLGHEGFPAASCLSVNDAVVHGIPDETVIQEGDLLGIDVGLWLDGVCTDTAITIAVGGKTDPESLRLIQRTYTALRAGVKAIKPFRRVGSISSAVQEVAEAETLGIVRGLTGHGVGHAVWEDPEVPNYGKVGDGAVLRPGMVIAIEPMFTLGTGATQTDVDGWTVRSADGKRAAQHEYTVLITQSGAEILTQWQVPPYFKA